MWTACCQGGKIIDFRDSLQRREKGPVGPFGLAREEILISWHQLASLADIWAPA